MVNMSLKIGEARERMILKTPKCTLSFDCRIRSARASSKGVSANFTGVGDVGDEGFEGGMTGELKLVLRRKPYMLRILHRY